MSRASSKRSTPRCESEDRSMIMKCSENEASYLDDKSVLVTGGTGSFGQALIATILRETKVRRVVVFSRDELKQYEMRQHYHGDDRLRFFIGDVRDPTRLQRAFDGVHLVVHAAALKQVDAAEYNPFEAVHTNILGAENVINAAIDQGVQRVIALSTDKASGPANIYGATKLVSDKLFIAGNAYAGSKRTRMAVVRYGNVVGSRGSVVPYFEKMAATGKVPITDARMTRFWVTLPQAVESVRASLARMHGGEIFVPKLPSMRIVDLAAAIAPDAKHEFVGIRPGEKLHEELIGETAARHSLDMGDHYVIQPEMDWWRGELDGKPLPAGFSYTSDTNSEWLTVSELRAMLVKK
jgi:UDP-N-acetylglucosamine 4,6-dehydratase/5-epimerase